jgi:hypothetical protein
MSGRVKNAYARWTSTYGLAEGSGVAAEAASARTGCGSGTDRARKTPAGR